jgi:hypothetical protein
MENQSMFRSSSEFAVDVRSLIRIASAVSSSQSSEAFLAEIAKRAQIAFGQALHFL